MRGPDRRNDTLFSYVRPDSRIPKDHPLRQIRRLTDAALASLSAEFDALYAEEGRGSNIDARTTGRPGYKVSQVIRKRIEEANGWLKTIGGMAQTKHRGQGRVGWIFQLRTAAYNLIRLPKLVTAG